jgi:hypothetical protein
VARCCAPGFLVWTAPARSIAGSRRRAIFSGSRLKRLPQNTTAARKFYDKNNTVHVITFLVERLYAALTVRFGVAGSIVYGPDSHRGLAVLFTKEHGLQLFAAPVALNSRQGHAKAVASGMRQGEHLWVS